MTRTRRYSRGLMIVLATAWLAVACPQEPSPGDLDQSFGTDGKLTTDFGLQEQARAVAVQPNGKIIVAGSSFDTYDNNPHDNPHFWTKADLALARYKPDGSLDSTFGNNGRLTTDFWGSRIEHANDLVLQPDDGKIVVAVRTGDSTLARYNPDGTLDKNFSGDGKVSVDLGSVGGVVGYDEALALARQPDGKLIAAGTTEGQHPFFTLDTDFAILRFNLDGSLDESFDGDGKVFTDMGDEQAWIYDVAMRPDGKLVVAGYTGTASRSGPGEDAPALARYNADGSLDTTFSGDGKLVGGTYESPAYALVLQTDGKTVTAGFSFDNDGNHDFALTRYNPDGSLDTTFGVGGKVSTDFGSDEQARTLVLQDDGKLLAAGYSTADDPERDFALARYTASGKLDTSFSTDGKLTTDFGQPDEALAMALQPFDGKIIIAGRSGNDFALARYRGGGKEE